MAATNNGAMAAYYYIEPDARIAMEDLTVKEIPAMIPHLQIGAVSMFPQPGQIEQIRAAIDDYLDAKNRCACGHPAHPEGQCDAVVVEGVRSMECPCLGNIGGAK
jgi:hypothetical protein